MIISGCAMKGEHSSVIENISNEKVDEQFKAILLNPEKFDSVEVELTGIFTYEFENVAIYLTSKDADSLFSSKAFWVNEYEPRDSLLDKKFKMASHKRVHIKGRFEKDDKGHLSSYAGAINEVKDLDIE